jgi:hypothetical protein
VKHYCGFENDCGEGTVECGSASCRRSLVFHCGSFAAALHDTVPQKAATFL